MAFEVPMQKWIKRLIPSSWRETVVRDIEMEATQGGTSERWLLWQMAFVGVRLRLSLVGEHLVTDTVLAVRRLGKSPLFAGGAMLTFALGAGLNLAAFSVADQMLFKPLPFADPDRLVSIFAHSPDTNLRYTRVSKSAILTLAADGTLIEGFASVDSTCDPLRRVGGEAPMQICPSTPNVLDVLGIRPVIGRGFEEGDSAQNLPVALITHETWQSQFGGRSDVLGSVLRGRSMVYGALPPPTIVGVLPPGFVVPSVHWSGGGDGLRLSPARADRLESPTDGISGIVARLAPEATIADVQTRIDHILDEEATRTGESRGHLLVEPLQDGVFWRYRDAMQLLTAAASLLWLLACANVSMMVALRGRRRESDVAISAALGASPGRLASGAMVETLVVCGGGVVIAFLTLMWALPAIQSLVPAPVAGVVSRSFDPRVMVVGLAVAVAGALIAGLLPALRMARTDLLVVLQRGNTRATNGHIGRGVLVAQTALGFLLVMSAAMVGRSFVALYAGDLGYAPRGLYAAAAVPIDAASAPRVTPEEAWANTRVVVDRLRSQRWIAAASADLAPLIGRRALDRPVTTEAGRRFGLRPVLDDFARTEGVSLIAGRDVTAEDLARSTDVTLISTTVVEALWPGVAPAAAVGRIAEFTGEAPRQVVGVFRDRRARPGGQPTPEVVVPARLGDRLTVILRLNPQLRPPDDLAVALASLMATGVPVRVALTDGGQVMSDAVRDPRMVMVAFAVFGMMAFGLGAVGLATIAGTVATGRKRDLAIRQVLGGPYWQLVWSVVGEVVRPVTVGLALGTLVALGTARYLQAQLYMVDAGDPGSYVLGWVVFLTVAFVLTWWPARAVARDNPLDSLKST
jgi:putative ABC transport system permease protein